MPCPDTRVLRWQHLVHPWEHCVVCMKLSQDTPEQLKPPETNAWGRQTVTAFGGGTSPQHRTSGNWADPRDVKLSRCWLSTTDRGAWISSPGRLKTSTAASDLACLRFDRNEKETHDESPTTASGIYGGVQAPWKSQSCRTQQGLERQQILLQGGRR